MKKRLLRILNRILNQLWYGNHPAYVLLLPFSLLYQAIVFVRRFYLLRFSSKQFPIPVIIVGNLTVGGVGKTPLVIAIANQLQTKGVRVGIVSRGYGGRQKKFPYAIQPSDSAQIVGDEPLLILKKTNCPVVISPKRVDAVEYLMKNYQPQVVISDDGLQHYALGRMIEIIVIDAVRQLGNGFCLPAGPLREQKSRLLYSHLIVMNGEEININNTNNKLKTNIESTFKSRDTNRYISNNPKNDKRKRPATYRMNIKPGLLSQVLTQETKAIEQIDQSIAAVAGIGNPERFFETLKELEIEFTPYAFPDHYHFQPADLELREEIVIMTEKDAVKCQDFAKESWYFLPIEARLCDSFWKALHEMLWSHEQI